MNLTKLIDRIHLQRIKKYINIENYFICKLITAIIQIKFLVLRIYDGIMYDSITGGCNISNLIPSIA